MSANTEYLNTSRADVPVVDAGGERVSSIEATTAPLSAGAASTYAGTGVAQALGPHTIHVDHDAPHTAQEKPTLPRHGAA
ncbi:hypothetical protein HKX48_006024 [Thoreauomyces humboldtii]|nr:hypothetical protein HKX48_006024 [Thoreauomyces humboldtii]